MDSPSLDMTDNPLTNLPDQSGFQAAQTLKWSMFGVFLRPRLSERRRTRFRLTACHRVITGPMQRIDPTKNAQILCDLEFWWTQDCLLTRHGNEVWKNSVRRTRYGEGLHSLQVAGRLMTTGGADGWTLSFPSAPYPGKSLKNAHRRGSGFKPRQHKYFRPNFVKIKILNIGK